MPKLSVIMSVYNTGNRKVLKLCIESLKSQTFNDFEAIICDDGSTDQTYNLLEELCGTDNRFILIRNAENLTSGKARNKCLALATGEYIAIMDADDYCAPTRFEEQLDYLEQHPSIDYVGTAAHLFDEKGIWGGRKYKAYPVKKDFLFVLPFIHASVMFRSGVLHQIKGYSEVKAVRRSEDYDLFMRLYATGRIGANLDKCLYYVREDQDAFRRRKYRYRWNELVVRYRGFKNLGLLPSGFLYIFKPTIVGLIPHHLLLILKEWYYKRKQV